jgi:PEGA domain-containing protein
MTYSRARPYKSLQKGAFGYFQLARHWRSDLTKSLPFDGFSFRLTRMNKALRLLRKQMNARPATPDARKADAMSSGQSDPLSDFAEESGLATQAVPKGAPEPVSHVKPSAPSPLQPGRPVRPSVRVRWPASATAFVALALAVAGLIWVYQQLIPIDAATPKLAKLNIVTEPAGIDVIVNGELKGVSPLSMSLAAGAQSVTLRQGTDERVVPLTLTAGAEVTHHIEFTPRPAVVASTLGGISVVTDPAGAQVEVDGKVRGISPLALKDLASSDHKVRVIGANGSAERTVAVTSGTTTAVVFALPKTSAPIAGWVAVAAPFDVQVSEGANIVGTGKAAKIMLPAGRHTISLANAALQYESERTVDIAAGQTATVRVDAPKVPISANARPWADVTIDGTNVGQTPIANMPISIGTHEILFRHPQLGERRQTVVVTAKGPNRIAVDMTK